MVEDGYEFFARRQLVTIFSAPNYCGEFDNAGAMMSVDDTLMCSFQILKPAEKKQRITQAGEGALLSLLSPYLPHCSDLVFVAVANAARPNTPPVRQAAAGRK